MKRRHPRRNISLRLTVASTALVVVFLSLALGGYYFWKIDYEQRQLDEQILAETSELLGLHNQAGGSQLALAIRDRLASISKSEEEGDHYYLYIESDTRVLAGNVAGWPGDVSADANGNPQTITLDSRHDLDAATVFQHQARVRVELLDNGGRLLVGKSLDDRSSHNRNLRIALVLGGCAMLLFAITTGLLMSRSLLIRVGQMNHTILRILGGNPSERMPYRQDGDEFDELAHHFDKMLDENERLVTGMRAVSDDIAHDLRTPLARVLNQVDVALAGNLQEDGLRKTLEDVRQDTSSVLATFHELLLIAQIESGGVRDRMEKIALEEVLASAVDLYQPLAEESGLAFEVATEPCWVHGNAHLLAQVCTNLIDNAVKYTHAPGKVAVRLECLGNEVKLKVADDGPGIPVEEREHVLERFVRLDDSRAKPGTGLGLSFVRAVADLHGAKLELKDAQPGLIVVLTFARMRVDSEDGRAE